MITIPVKREENYERREPVEKLAVSAVEAAEMIGVSERTLWQWTKERRVPSVKIGRKVLYPVDGLRRFVNGDVERG